MMANYRFTLALVLMLGLGTACSLFQRIDPFGPAETFEQTAFASIGVATIYLELAAEIAEDKDTSLAATKAVAAAAAPVYAAVTVATQALQTYQAVKRAPDSTPEKINAALAELSEALAKIPNAVTALQVALRGLKEPS